MDINRLEIAYQQLSALFSAYQQEPFASVLVAEQHRWHWKPERVKTLLLAESHVYTSPQESVARLAYPATLPFTGLPENYVRLVYCLGYGEEKSLCPANQSTSGTPHYWKLFASAVGVDKASVLKTGILNADARVLNKLYVLNQLHDKGIWLLDTSVLGLYNMPLGKPGLDLLEQALLLSWRSYIQAIVEEAAPERILCVGKHLWRLIGYDLQALSPESSWIYQPNAHLTKEQIALLYDQCGQFCR